MKRVVTKIHCDENGRFFKVHSIKDGVVAQWEHLAVLCQKDEDGNVEVIDVLMRGTEKECQACVDDNNLLLPYREIVFYDIDYDELEKMDLEEIC